MEVTAVVVFPDFYAYPAKVVATLRATNVIAAFRLLHRSLDGWRKVDRTLLLGADQPIQPTQCRIGTHLAIWAVPGMSGEPSKRVRDLGALTLAAREPQLPQAANDGRVSLATALPTEEMTRTAVHCVRDLYWKAVSVKD